MGRTKSENFKLPPKCTATLSTPGSGPPITFNSLSNTKNVNISIGALGELKEAAASQTAAAFWTPKRSKIVQGTYRKKGRV